MFGRISYMKNKTGLFFKTDNLGDLPLVEQHIHTNFTDGANSPEEIVEYAIKQGFSRIFFTEHVQRGSDWYPAFVQKMAELKNKYSSKIDIIIGLEAKQINQLGDLDCTDSQKAAAEVVMGSVHGYPATKEGKFYDFDDLTPEKALELELENCLKLISRSADLKMNVIGHPFGVYIKNYQKPVPEDHWRKVLAAATANNVAFDLNFKYHQPYFKIILAIAEESGTFINIGSDVHSLAEFGQAVKAVKNL